MGSGLQAAAQGVGEELLGLAHEGDDEAAAGEDEVLELGVGHARLQGVGDLAVQAHDAAVGDGEVGLGADPGGVPLLDQAPQGGQVVGVGDAVPHAAQLDGAGVLEDECRTLMQQFFQKRR